MNRRLSLIASAALAAIALCAAAGLPRDPELAHQRADGIEGPRLLASLNEFWAQHPADRPGADHRWEHTKTLDAKDQVRGAAAIAAAEDWIRMMRRAGY